MSQLLQFLEGDRTQALSGYTEVERTVSINVHLKK